MPRRLALSLTSILLLGLAAAGRAGSGQEVAFTPEFLRDPKTLELGKKVWQERCTFCHGKTAYPGKAPRLDPSRYTPEFVYDRVTNGFRAMPAWKHEYSEEERKAVAAYVMSREFPN